MKKRILLYGANGTTGRITVEVARDRGIELVLGGRSASVDALALANGLEAIRFSLDDKRAVARALEGFDAVIHMAGPFSATCAPMLAGCLASKTHYLDITGELDVFEMCQSYDSDAKEAGIVIKPGVGFDVVPTDCLAAQLADKLPGARSLTLGFFTAGVLSVGTTKTAIEGLPHGGAERVDGKIVRTRPGVHTRRIPYPSGEKLSVAIPWGDVSTAYWSTGIDNIRVYMSVPPSRARAMKRLGYFQGVLGLAPVQWALSAAAERFVKGPTPEMRDIMVMEVWGEVRHDDGRSVTGTLTVPEGYFFTADAALRATELVCAGVAPGYQTPSRGLGSDFVASCAGAVMHGLHEIAPTEA